MKKNINLLEYNNQITKYLIVGICTTFISLGSYYILTLILDPNDAFKLQIANVFSWILAVTFAFFANKKYVFKYSVKFKICEMLKFFQARMLTLVVDILCMFTMVTVLNFNHKIAKFIVQFIVFVLNYLLSKFVVFVNNKK